MNFQTPRPPKFTGILWVMKMVAMMITPLNARRQKKKKKKFKDPHYPQKLQSVKEVTSACSMVALSNNPNKLEFPASM